MIDQFRSNKTLIALTMACLSILYTWVELKTEVNTKRTALGHYVRNFTFSFIIVYSGLLIFDNKHLPIPKIIGGNNLIKQTHIMTGRPNF